MAIQVNGTEVISNSRALNNIASVDATTAASITAAGVGDSATAQNWLGHPADGMNNAGWGMQFANGRFISTREDGIFYSDDAISWSQSTLSGTQPSGNHIFQAVYCGSNIWIAVGDNSRVYRSTNNGVNFSYVSTSINGFVGGVATNADNSIQVLSCLGSNGLWYSTNTGQSWTQVSGTGGNNFYGVGFGNGRFMSTKPSTNQTLTSTNGTSWSYVTAPANTLANMYYQVAAPVYANGIWAIPIDGGRVLTSSNDGASWTIQSTNVGYQTFSIHYANDVWLLTGGGGYLFKAEGHTSGSTSLSFQQIPNPLTNSSTWGIAYGNDKWAVNLNNQTKVMTSA